MRGFASPSHNQHMVAINAELGYELGEPLEPLEQAYELPVANAR